MPRMIVHTLANQLLPQILMEQLDILPNNVGKLNICMKDFDSKNIYY